MTHILFAMISVKIFLNKVFYRKSIFLKFKGIFLFSEFNHTILSQNMMNGCYTVFSGA